MMRWSEDVLIDLLLLLIGCLLARQQVDGHIYLSTVLHLTFDVRLHHPTSITAVTHFK